MESVGENVEQRILDAMIFFVVMGVYKDGGIVML